MQDLLVVCGNKTSLEEDERKRERVKQIERECVRRLRECVKEDGV